MDRRRSASAGYSSARTTAAWRATSSRSGSTSADGGAANASSVARGNAVRAHKRVSSDASSASAWSSIAARGGRGGDGKEDRESTRLNSHHKAKSEAVL